MKIVYLIALMGLGPVLLIPEIASALGIRDIDELSIEARLTVVLSLMATISLLVRRKNTILIVLAILISTLGVIASFFCVFQSIREGEGSLWFISSTLPVLTLVGVIIAQQSIKEADSFRGSLPESEAGKGIVAVMICLFLSILIGFAFGLGFHAADGIISSNDTKFPRQYTRPSSYRSGL